MPTGRYFGIKEQKKKIVPENPVLESAFRKFKSYSTTYLELSKKTGMTERQIQRWMRMRSQRDTPSTMKKFEDCSWHFLFYLVLFWYGLYALWDKPWFSKTLNCWVGWPKQHVSDDIYWYYCIELGFYWSLLLSLSTDHKRKAAKMAKYIKKETLSTALFIVFLLVWILTRMIIFPFYVLYSATIESKSVTGLSESPSHMFFNGLLYVLQLLHVLWTFMILHIAYRKVSHGKMDDVRSDSEGNDVTDEEERNMVECNGVRPRSKGIGEKGHQ